MAELGTTKMSRGLHAVSRVDRSSSMSRAREGKGRVAFVGTRRP